MRCMNELVQLYETWNQPDKTATWKEKLSALNKEPEKNEGDREGGVCRSCRTESAR